MLPPSPPSPNRSRFGLPQLPLKTWPPRAMSAACTSSGVPKTTSAAAAAKGRGSALGLAGSTVASVLLRAVAQCAPATGHLGCKHSIVIKLMNADGRAGVAVGLRFLSQPVPGLDSVVGWRC